MFIDSLKKCIQFVAEIKRKTSNGTHRSKVNDFLITNHYLINELHNW